MNSNTSKPAFRKLRGYAFDPSFSSTISRRQSNQVIYKIKWEETKAGPVGEYIEIIDYDPTQECFYEAINLEHSYVLADFGLTPSEGDPRFHQQQVYAVIMSVIAQFERALGRKIIWSRRVEKPGEPAKYEYVDKLRVYPHAMRQQNAYYSPEKTALLFGYFQAAQNWSGNNVPGTAIFTCLSPDIVAHEVTHAILDGMHPYWRRGTNPDMLAFHEGFSDIIALLQRFTFTTVVAEQIRNSRGDLLSPQNLLGDLAIQFGQAVSSNRRALRSFLVETDSDGKSKLVEPDPSKYYTTTEPHGRGAILVAAIFGAFTRLYRYKVADLIRLASNGSGVLAQGDIHPDLVKRLSEEACEIANKLLFVCIRSLDYCPPVDLTFGDYLRALITSDLENSPDDEEGLRFALLESFRSWGIIPKGINTFSVESLLWKPLSDIDTDTAAVTKFRSAIQYIFNPDPNQEQNTGYTENPNEQKMKYSISSNNNISEVIASIDKILRENNRKTIYEESNKLSAKVHNIFNAKFEYLTDPALENVRKMERVVGMNFSMVTYAWKDENNKKIQLKAKARRIFQVYKCRPVIRNSNQSGISSKLMVITFLQKVYVNLKDSPYQGYFPNDEYEMRGGATLIVNLTDYEIEYAIIKDISDPERLRNQLDFMMENLSDADNAALLMQGNETFAALHSHF